MVNNTEDVKEDSIKFVDFVISDEEKFATSMRGKYIIAQALHYAIQAMELVPMPYREVSNIKDMEYLRDTIYYFPITPESTITEVESLTAKLIEDGRKESN